STKLKLLGVDVPSFGDAQGTTEGALEVVLNDAPGRRYAKLVVSDDATTLLGGVLVGDASAYAGLRPLVGRELPGDPLDLIAGDRGGVAIDSTCRTSGRRIYAVGECASAQGTVYGLVAPGNAMAEVAADNLAGGRAAFTGGDTSTKLKLLGVDVPSFGDAQGTTEGAL
ncbi:nitrite reductase (NAD(P)H), partial [Streptomonospora algeriensis]